MPAPNVLRASATTKTGLVRASFDFPVGGDGSTWGWSCTLSPDVADALADQLRAAAKIARIEAVAKTERDGS